MRTPTALKIALATAGSTGLAHISPGPLAPNGPSAAGRSSTAMSCGQMSPGPGIRYSTKSRGPWLGIGIIGLGRLVERVADAHPGAADELLLDQPRIERAAELIGAVHPHHRDFAGLVVDLDLGDQAGMGVAGRRRHLAGLGIDLGERHQEDAAARRSSCPA